MNALEFVQEIETMMGWSQSSTIEGTLSKETRQVVSASNAVLLSVQGDRDWQELSVDGSIRMDKARSVDTDVTITFGSTTLSTSSATFVADDVGRLVMVSTSTMAYRISAYTSSTQVIISRAWVEDDLSGITSEVFIGQDTYELSAGYDRLLVEKLYNPVAQNWIQVVGASELAVRRQELGLGLNIGEPTKCTIHGLSSDGKRRKVHFDVCPQLDYELDFTYQRKHPELVADSVDIAYPPKDLLYLLDMVKARLDRDSEVAQTAAQVASDALNARNKMQQNRESGTDPLRVVPQTLRHGRRRRRF